MNTIRTLAAAALAATSLAAQAGVDLTLLPGISTSASSCYTGCGKASHDHGNIIDDDRLNNGPGSWNSGTYGGWVQLDLGSTWAIERVELYANYPYGNSFTLTASTDGVNFSTLGSGSYHLEPALSLGPAGNYGGQKFGAVFSFASGSEPVARYLRYTRTGGADWGYLQEIEAIGRQPTAPVPEPGTWALMLAGGAYVLRRCRKAS